MPILECKKINFNTMNSLIKLGPPKRVQALVCKGMIGTHLDMSSVDSRGFR